MAKSHFGINYNGTWQTLTPWPNNNNWPTLFLHNIYLEPLATRLLVRGGQGADSSAPLFCASAGRDRRHFCVRSCPLRDFLETFEWQKLQVTLESSCTTSCTAGTCTSWPCTSSWPGTSCTCTTGTCSSGTCTSCNCSSSITKFLTYMMHNPRHRKCRVQVPLSGSVKLTCENSHEGEIIMQSLWPHFQQSCSAKVVRLLSASFTFNAITTHEG